MVERDKVCGQSSVKLLILRVQHQEDEVKPTEKSVRELDVLYHCRTFVPLRHARISSCQDRGTGIEGADDTSLSNGESLLLL